MRLPNGRALSKYPIGWSLTLAPFYAAAHYWTQWLGRYPPDGYSRPYQQGTILAGLCCGLLGLWLLHRSLRMWFSSGITLGAVAALVLGSNLFNYLTYEANTAHAALFMWQSGLLLATVRWHRGYHPRDAAGIGLCLGMAALTRPTEVLFVLVPLLWGVTGWLPLRARPALLWRHRAGAGLAVLIAAGLLSLQLAYWRAVSGHFVLYSYGPERFDFSQPHVLDGLFSFRKGWLLYSPLLALALVGVGTLRGAARAALGPILVLTPVLVYVTFCWWQWWYGASFGCRPLISLYPLLAVPLASLFASAASHRRWPARLVKGAVVLCVVLNLWQTRQYRSAILHWDSETRAMYFTNFFRL